MESKNSYGTGSLIIAAVSGALVGAGVAMLLAPKSGHDTREQIADYAKSTASLIPKAFKNASHAVGKVFKSNEEDEQV